MTSKKSKILIIFLLVLIVIRVALPAIMLPQINNYLKDFSAAYSMHIDDFGLSLLRGAYRFEGLTATARDPKVKDPFLTVGLIDVSISWREIFHGRILTDVVADNVKLILTQELLAAVDKASKEAKAKELAEGKKAAGKFFPLEISRVDLRNSDFLYADVAALPPEMQLHVTGLEGRISNVTPLEKDPISIVIAKGSLLGSGTIKAVGELNLLQKPINWDMDIEVHDFELTKINPLLTRKGPLTFERGHLDVYAEVKSEAGKIEGYAKPFLKKATFIGDQGDFKSLKHLGLEIGAAAINALLKSRKDHTVASKILFSYDKGNFEWNFGHAIRTAIAHGFEDKIEPGIENTYQLSAAASQPKEKHNEKN
ncbi:MAG: DUF748 domain-containing protein [Bdellovibrionaceae bacterium]|nr:DUF748 domain-containing protein [Bdellovibrio sp.]